MTVSRGKDDTGFTLIEVLVATALVVIGLMSIASLAGVSIRLVADSRDRTIEAALAVQKIEQLASARLSSVDTSPVNALEVDVPGFAERVDARGVPVAEGSGRTRVFIRRWAVRPSADAGLPLVVRVRVATPAELAHASTLSAGVLLTAARSREID